MMEKITAWDMNKNVNYPKLKGSLKAEVVIIGGGLTGILTGYELSRMGKSVTILEKDRIGSGATRLTTAFLTAVIDTNYSDLINSLGLDKARQIAESHRKGIDLIEEIISHENINYDFKKCSNYIYTNKEESKELRDEEEALRKVGFDAVLKTEPDLGIKTTAYIEVKNQARFHPIKFIKLLAEIIVKNGGRIFEDTKVIKLEKGKVITEEGSIKAPFVISATYGPLMRPPGLHFKKAFYTSYVLEISMPKGKLKEGIYEDTDNPYHYFRVDDNDNDSATVILGGADHRSDIPVKAEEKYEQLESYARKIFAGIDFNIVRRWSGPIIEPVDGLPYIGKYKDYLYATAFSGNGMTYAAISAMILSDIVTKKQNKWQKIYDPRRIPSLKLLSIKGRDYLEELWNGVIRKK